MSFIFVKPVDVWGAAKADLNRELRSEREKNRDISNANASLSLLTDAKLVALVSSQ